MLAAGPFPDPAATAEGWYVADLLATELLDELRHRTSALGPVLDDPFHATSAQSSRPVATAVQRWILEAVGPILAAAFPAHRPFLAAVISKGAVTGGPVAFHQDWTYTDERRHRAVLAWMPLVDTDERSGALRAVPGSHRWTDAIRPSGAPLATEPLQDLFAEQAVTVPVRAGEGFVYDPALVHGSWPNQAALARPVVAVALAPVDADLVHFSIRNGVLHGHRVDDAWFTACEYAQVPANAPAVAPWGPAVAPNDLVRPGATPAGGGSRAGHGSSRR